jgi:outer membrane protein assembly factor BamA
VQGHQRLSPLVLSSTIERTNDPLSPTSGYRVQAELEHASTATMSDYRYNRAAMDGTKFFRIRRKGVLAAHLRLGWVGALGSTATAVGLGDSISGEILHPRRRFFAGGARSVRGYGENQLGPRVLTIPSETLRRDSVGCGPSVPISDCDPNAAVLTNRDFEPRPLGGNTVAEGSVELRFPLKAGFVGAAFVDAAVVTQRINLGLPGSAAALTPGFGIRYRSPAGPIRIDIGINPLVSELLPVVTDQIVDGKRQLVPLANRRDYGPVRASGIGGALNRLTLHLSIGEAF